MKVGVVGYQGDVAEHLESLYKLRTEYKRDVDPVTVRDKKTLQEVAALIIPGGESTTIYKLIKEFDLFNHIIRRVRMGMPLMGTCAGLILISREPNDERVRGMGLLNVSIRRNAYGRQINSFQEMIRIKGLGLYNAIFIRAPMIESVGPDVEVLAEHNGFPVMVRSGYVLGLTFHPELTGNTIIHNYFLGFVGRGGSGSSGTREWYVEDVA